MNAGDFASLSSLSSSSSGSNWTWPPSWTFAPNEHIKFNWPSNSSRCPFEYEIEFPEITDRWSFVYHLVIWDSWIPPPGYLWNLCFCAHGSVFISFLILSLVILLVSAACCYYVFFKGASAGTQHRKILFLCLLCASIVRTIYSSMAMNKVMGANTMEDIMHFTKFFVKTLIPTLAVSDWLTGLVDVAMAFFWYSVHNNRDFSVTNFLLCAMGTCKVLVMLCTYDATDVMEHQTEDPYHFYDRLLWYIAVMVFCGAVSHIVVAVVVIRSALSTSSDVVWWARFRALWPMFVIVFVTATAGLVRAGVLIGRQSGIPFFYSGRMSFNNPAFTEAYFIVIMQIPPLVVSLIAATMTAKSVKDAQVQESIGDQLVLDRGSGYGTSQGGGDGGGVGAEDDPDM